MIDPKNIELQRHADGTPSILRKTVVYQELNFYKRSDILYQMTVVFCRRFLPLYGDRNVDQMVQAARSTMQNIAEGSVDGQTSVETEIKLLGVAKGSNHELLGDYQNHLKSHHLTEWWGSNPRAENLHRFCKEHTAVEEVDKGLTTYIANRDREFVEQGGIRERMYAARTGFRAEQDAKTKHMEAENERLLAENQRLKEENARLRKLLSGKPG